MRHALIVDDEPDVLLWMSEVVRSEGYTVATANSLRTARAQLVRQQPEVLLTDLQLSDGQGTELVHDLDAPSQTEVVVITGPGSITSAIDAVRIGATDYLTKPVELSRLLSILRRQPQATELKHEIGELRDELRRAGRFGPMLGSSSAMQAVYDKLSRVAPTSATVLLRGEPGTGKTLAARTIHHFSRRRRAPFLSVDCASSSASTLGDELFGHERHGADRHQRGLVERAHGGTLLLDNIYAMPDEVQARLLRLLETGAFLKTPSGKPVAADVRLIASSTSVIDSMVATGRFREALYRRLQAFCVDFPPLAARGSDLDMLAHHFLDRHNRAEGVRKHIRAERGRSHEPARVAG